MPHTRTSGPKSFIARFGDRFDELSKLDWICEGMDTKRCPWPVGVWTKHMMLCQEDYVYSYKLNKCFIKEPHNDAKCSHDLLTIGKNLHQMFFYGAEAILNETCKLDEHDCGHNYQTLCIEGNDGCHAAC